ncbi:putative aminoadipate reductase [Mycena crocata]|nr:putative aminoadipate reductase [Mycena crocata]
MSPSWPAPPAPMRISEAIAWNSKTYPTAPFYLYAAPDPSFACGIVTHLEFGRATHRAAHILRPNREGSDGQVVALVAQSDTVLQHAVVAGLMTANLIPFPISPRNSAAAVVNLLQRTSCHRLLATCVTLRALLAEVKQEIKRLDPDFSLVVEEIPSLAEIYPNLGAETEGCAFEPYPEPSRQPSLDDTCLYLHSSGSTGLPKAIPETHRALMQWSTLAAFTELRDHISHPVAAMPIPSFHMSGLYLQLLQPVYGVTPVAVYPPTASSPDALPIFPSPDNVLEHARKTKCKSITILPAFFAAWAQLPNAVNFLKTLDMAICSGGSLPQRLGDSLVAAGVKLRNLYGTTEFGAISALIPWAGDELEWEWVRFPEEVTLRWDPQGDGTFECQVLSSDKHTTSLENLKDVRGYATSDLWVNHPTKPHLWKMVGRIDDVIVHTSGEKTVPAPMEDIVLSNSDIVGAVMFGWERDQTGILIEMIPSLQVESDTRKPRKRVRTSIHDVRDSAEVIELRNKLWPTIEEANRIAPAFSRIFKEMLIFTSAEKPFPRTGKGTVMRKAALKLYASEINALYNLVGEKTRVPDSIKSPSVWEATSIEEWLLELAADLSSTPKISRDVDLFHQGFDSLSATFLRLRILSAIRSSKDLDIQNAAAGIAQNLVYAYPTISHLANYLARLCCGIPAVLMNTRQLLDSFIAKHTSHLMPPSPVMETVLVTGTTGNLGSQLLAALLKEVRVAKVYALNRPSGPGASSSAERQRMAFEDRGLDVAFLDSPKMQWVESHNNEIHLGLDSSLYDDIRSSVTLIIHNAWQLDFNLSLSSFEPHVLGTRHLVDLALSSPRAPKFVFTSSIASAISWDPLRGPCPEEVLTEKIIIGNPTGYGQSKFVAEQIIAKSGLPSSCLRIGQICGSVPTGAWSTSDWVPILIKTSLALGCLPVADGLISWIDFDVVTNAIMDVAFATPKSTYSVFNVVHPKPVSWNLLMGTMRDIILAQKKVSAELRLVPFSEWFAALEFASKCAPADYIPGIKLLDFFHSLAKASAEGAGSSEFGGIDFSTEKIQAISSAVKNAQAISEEHVAAWIRYWIASGFI